MKNEKVYMTPKQFFSKKMKAFILLLLGFLVITWFSANMIKFEFLIIFKKFGAAVGRFFSLYLPPNFSKWQELIEGVWVTIVLAVAASIIGSILAYGAALLMSKKTTISPIIGNIVRFITTFIRNVPTSIWAIVLLMAFWYGEFLALLVMTIGSFGFNARVFADSFDEASANSIEALNAVGATKTHIISQSVYQETLPSVISWTLYAIETNIRSSTVIGMLAGGGIGHLIGIYRNFRRFEELSAAVILTVIVVLLFDQLSGYIRGRLMA